MGKYATFAYGSGVHYGEGEGIIAPFWTILGGGNHFNKDWFLTEDTAVAGIHYNIGHFEVAAGVVLTVEPYDGSQYGSFEVLCKSANVIGAITGSLRGHPGGPGGGGGGGAGTTLAGAGGVGGLAPVGVDGLPGSAGSVGAAANGGVGGSGANGTGTYGGSAGSGGDGTGLDGGLGAVGGYATSEGQGDGTVDDSLRMGSGGGGGGGGGGKNTILHSITGGGGGAGGSSGGSGGAIVKIDAIGGIIISGKILSHGGFAVGGVNGGCARVGVGVDGGAGGAPTDETMPGVGGTSAPLGIADGGDAGVGGVGAGGGILLKTAGAIGLVIAGEVKTLGGMTEAATGGTVKKLHAEGEDHTTGTIEAGRTYTDDSLTQGRLV